MMYKIKLPVPTDAEKKAYIPTEKLAYKQTGKIGKTLSPRLEINYDLTIEGEKDSYTLLAKEKIGAGGESQVFFAVSRQGKRFVAKVYDNMEDTPAQNEFRKVLCKFLIIKGDFVTDCLMPLIDFGEISIVNNNRVYRRHVDILPFCNEGNFDRNEKVSFEKLRCEIIPRLAKALKTLHDNGFVHRDVKPANIFTLENKIVLGDFGTVSIIDEEDDFTLTKKNRGTLGYTAPEIIGGNYAVVASDWYSLGCTIATLYLGRHPYEDILRSKDRVAFYRLMNTQGLPLNCPEQWRSLQILVDSLVRTNEEERAGYDEIMQWCKNPDLYRPKQYKKEALPEKTFYFKFEKTECTSSQDLIKAMLEDWEKAIKYLYRGGVKSSVISQAFANIDQALVVKVGDIIEDEETAYDHNLGVAKFLNFLSKSGRVYWMGKAYDNLQEVAREIGINKKTDSTIVEMLKSRYLSWLIGNREFFNADDAAIESIRRIENFAGKHPSAGLYLLKYAMLDQEKYRGLNSYDEIFVHLFRMSRSFENDYTEILQDPELLGFIAARSDYNFVEKYLSAYKNNDAVHNLLLMYHLFEKRCQNKMKVRQHFCIYGPKGYLFWIRENLDVYNFLGEIGRKIKSKFLSNEINLEMSISELEYASNVLYENVSDLKTYFHGNPLMVYFSLEHSETEKCIKAKELAAYFTDLYFGVEIPHGYKIMLDGGRFDG